MSEKQAKEPGPEDQALGMEAAKKLNGFKEQMRQFMHPHAIATAFLLVGIEAAAHYRDPAQIAEWLRDLADEVEKPGAKGTAH